VGGSQTIAGNLLCEYGSCILWIHEYIYTFFVHVSVYICTNTAAWLLLLDTELSIQNIAVSHSKPIVTLKENTIQKLDFLLTYFTY